MAAILPKLNAGGVKLLLGDDYGAYGLPHDRYADELALYGNEVGIPALDVIRWATKYGAEAMGMGERTGTIAAGMQPSSAEYWHIGAMTMRLASFSEPTRNGVNKAGAGMEVSGRWA